MSRLRLLIVGVALFSLASSVCSAQRSAPLAFQSQAHPDSIRAHPPDSFTGPDKVKHFMMSAFIEAIGFSALQSIDVNRSASISTATAVTLGIGFTRELHDRRATGLFSVGDLTWDTIGTAAALLLISHAQR